MVLTHSPCAHHCSENLTCWQLVQSSHILFSSYYHNPLFRMWKPRHREVKQWLRVTQLRHGRAGICTQAVWLESVLSIAKLGCNTEGICPALRKDAVQSSRHLFNLLGMRPCIGMREQRQISQCSWWGRQRIPGKLSER